MLRKTRHFFVNAKITDAAEKKSALLMLCGFKAQSQCSDLTKSVDELITAIAEAFKSRQTRQLIRHKLTGASSALTKPVRL